MGGTQEAIKRQSSGNQAAIKRQSSGNQAAIKRQLSGNWSRTLADTADRSCGASDTF
jgi:hypothetical protein